MIERIDKEAGLEPCPFCGGEATIEYQDEFRAYRAYCTRTGCEYGTPDYWLDTEADAVAAWNRRSGGGECMPELGTVMALSILETRCAVTEGMYHALRTAVEQVRDEIRDRPMRFGVKYRVKDELNLIVDTLTRILDDDETETDKFKRKTKPITTRIGKD